MNHRPVCATCQTEMRPEQNDVRVLDVADFGPYKLWMADLWKCPSCGASIVIGFGHSPFAQHFEETFVESLAYAREHNTLFEVR